jgi:nicotinic acid phosphoribosyltransferase
MSKYKSYANKRSFCYFRGMSRKYKFHNKSDLYFVSFATVYWIEVFTRQVYFHVLVDSINYCRAEKGMELLRDFKKHTSKKAIEVIENNPQESRREWLLWMFKRAGKKQGNISKYQFWQHHNKPIELWSEKVIKQKIDYIHNNPVEIGFVTNPEDWKYSSARNFQEDHTVLEIDDIGFLG